MGYLGIYLKAFQLGKLAAENVKVKCNIATESGRRKFIDKSYENVEAFTQLGKFSYLGGELMKQKNVDAAVHKYDEAVADGVKSVMLNLNKPRGR